MEQSHYVTKKRNKSNFRRKQWEALKEIKNNDSIVLKEAEKGGGTIVMGKQQYLTEA